MKDVDGRLAVIQDMIDKEAGSMTARGSSVPEGGQEAVDASMKQRDISGHALRRHGEHNDKRTDAATGGIDLTPLRMDLQTAGSGDEFTFNIDPVMLQKFQDAPGFSPVIINIQPVTDLKMFLGVKDHEKAAVIG